MPSKTSSNIQAERDAEFSTLVAWYEQLEEKHIRIWSVLRRSK